MPGVNVRSITFAGADDGVSALLVSPTNAAASGPGLVFVHWGFGDRTSFEREATSYAHDGVTSLLIDAPGYGRRKGARVGSKDAAIVQAYTERIIGDLVCAVDSLATQPNVDPSRLGYVGHSLGASIAGAFLARERRMKAAVLMTPAGRISKLWLTGDDPMRRLETFDNVVSLPDAPIPLLFQFAERDEWITRADADAQIAAAAGPTTVQWYRADHALDAAALGARAEWLATTLALPRVPVMPNEMMLPRSQVRAYRTIKPLMRVRNWLARKR
jgi:dienelactone hydrolase